MGATARAPASGRPGVAASASAQQPIESGGGAHGPAPRVAALLRGGMAGYPTADVELTLGMVTGDDSQLPASDRRTMQSAGLSHLTAVSGANIAMILAVVVLGCRLVGLPRGWTAVPMAAVLLAFVGLVGPSPSVVRAAAMAAIGIAGIVLGGGTGMAALLTGIVVLLGVDPWLAQSRGFALSCAATAGLILAVEPGRRVVLSVRERTGSVLLALIVANAVTAVAAGAATAPLLAAYGQGVTWVSLVANVAVAPLVPVVTFGGFAVIGLAAAAHTSVALVGPSALDHALLGLTHAVGWVPSHGVRHRARCRQLGGGPARRPVAVASRGRLGAALGVPAGCRGGACAPMAVVADRAADRDCRRQRRPGPGSDGARGRATGGLAGRVLRRRTR